MSAMVSVQRQLASAWVVLNGKYGDVTQQAQARGQSRQALYRETQDVIQTLSGQKVRAELSQLQQEMARASRQLVELQKRLTRAVEITPELQAEYASTAQALGVSLPVARALLAVFLGEQAPSVATLGRQTQAAAERAGALLAVLDEATRSQVKQAAADEIFFAGKRR